MFPKAVQPAASLVHSSCQCEGRRHTETQILTVSTSVFIYWIAASIWPENWNPRSVHCNTLGTVRACTRSLENTSTEQHTHTHRRLQRTCRGVSLLVPCRLGGGSCSWHTKSWRLPKPRGTVSIVRWALFSRYNRSSELWKHSLNPNSPCDWQGFTYFLIDKQHIVSFPQKKLLTTLNISLTSAALGDAVPLIEALTHCMISWDICPYFYEMGQHRKCNAS